MEDTKFICKIASWISWLGDFGRVPSRFAREVALTILIQNSIEFRVAFLNFQIKQMMLEYS